MKKILAGAAGAICFGLFASMAQAAPLGVTGGATSNALPSEVIQVHGLHTSCQRDRRGWHRSYIWGRQACTPPRAHRHKHRHHRRDRR
ncbi:hypothetical protein W911_12225 [Hyphomicrobium nitrativorans NL23]|uniref:Uncharacterized protein n=1 Tax=Hyphomicrobium nitrativorans NL23 TaxID=1029756 RepID=V5SIC3_9HYPH|nr:hypothetical protein [Hyphomicrobium nitrativorans]AHB50252.1 hypothetical protein W911_12225 [Hyphomicrobium nitrativorans NL23]